MQISVVSHGPLKPLSIFSENLYEPQVNWFYIEKSDELRKGNSVFLRKIKSHEVVFESKIISNQTKENILDNIQNNEIAWMNNSELKDAGLVCLNSLQSYAFKIFYIGDLEQEVNPYKRKFKRKVWIWTEESYLALNFPTEKYF